MTHDDIIRLAKEARFVIDEKARQHQPNCIFHTHHMIDEGLTRFAALVAAEKDREIKRLQDMLYEQLGELTALRAEKQMRGYIKQLKEQVGETTLDVSGATCFSATPAKWPVKEEQPK